MITRLIVSLLITMTLFAQEEDARAYRLSPKLSKQIAQSSHFTIALLPVQNATALATLPYHFRQRLKELLLAKGYGVVDFDALDRQLIQLGVQSTDQLELVDFTRLARMSSADAIMSGIVETGVSQNAVIFSGYAYTASLKLQSPQGDVLWYNLSERVAKRRIAIDPANIILNVLLDADDNKSIQAILSVADRLLEPLPNGPVVTIHDDLFNQAILLD